MRHLLISTILLLHGVLPASPAAGIASWYGDELRGQRMANGRDFNPDNLTCAHWTLPLGTRIIVSHAGKSVAVMVTDRGPHPRLKRELDLSRAAFALLADPSVGLINVKWTAPDWLNRLPPKHR